MLIGFSSSEIQGPIYFIGPENQGLVSAASCKQRKRGHRVGSQSYN